MAYPLKRPLLAVDTNIPLAIAGSKDFALDALQIVKDRLIPARIIVPPTAFQELVFGADHSETESERDLSMRALRLLRSNGLEVVTSIPVGTSVVEMVAERLHSKEVLPS